MLKDNGDGPAQAMPQVSGEAQYNLREPDKATQLENNTVPLDIEIILF